MRAPAYWRFLLVALLAGVFFFGLSGQRPAFAGGPLIVGGSFGLDAQPFTWDTSTPIQYTVDGGPLSVDPDGNVVFNNADGVMRVEQMFQVWETVSTATISYTNAGQITSIGVFTDGDVDTMEEFDAVEGDCLAGNQSPIVYDADGSLFDDLVGDPNVIGFAGPCQITPLGRIVGAIAALNGRFLDGTDTQQNPELTDAQFDTAFIHEFGHFSGLDHSQINVNCLGGGCTLASDDAFGLPTMFPFLLSGLEESAGNPAQLTLSPDDIAWISRLYPDSTFATTFGTIEGTIFFSDGQTPAQGVNVIARQEDDSGTPGIDESRRIAVSVVSGYLFTGNPGQSVTGTNPGSFFGSLTPTLVGFYRIPGLLPGNYTIEVESINAGFDAGSGVGPLNPPIPMPGTAPSPAGPFVVSAGGTVTGGTNITLVGTPPRFDQFEN
ncbi:MAG: hypothetical protein IH793_05890 [Acidobacteria bacterium]|nr:hypothetical protein [Acidobacteriota bacterium]